MQDVVTVVLYYIVLIYHSKIIFVLNCQTSLKGPTNTIFKYFLHSFYIFLNVFFF